MNLSRSQKALVSTVVAFILEIVNIISALVVPRLILSRFGSDVNGLINSITQFLGYISLLQMGVGGVIRAALFKPLAYNDIEGISSVVKASEKFFRRIGFISCAYIIVLAIVYPLFGDKPFDYTYIAAMVVIIGANTVAQYFWGFAYRNLLNADQRGYISSITSIIATILNILLTVFLINMGASIHVVKIISSVVFVLQPFVLQTYVRKKYAINKKAKPNETAIQQRWAGMGHSFADFVHRKTDIFVLTIASTLKEVSVYSVYAVVTNGLNAIITMATGSFAAALGNMLAKDERNAITDTMDIYVFLVHYVSSIVFSVAIVTVLPFVKLYTHGVTDADYYRPLFSVLLIVAETFYSTRHPYDTIIGAAGHFRQTQPGAIMEAIINLIISIILVKKHGIVGVAIGTLVGMIFRTFYSVVYLRKNIMQLDWKRTAIRYLVSTIVMLIVCLIGNRISFSTETFLQWIGYAIVISLVGVAVSTIINFIVYSREMKLTIQKFRGALKK